MTPDVFIRSIRETFGVYPQDSLGCYKFAKILLGVYGGEIWYNNNHPIVKIGELFYDIGGSYDKDDTVFVQIGNRIEQYPINEYLPLEEFGASHLMKVFNEVE